MTDSPRSFPTGTIRLQHTTEAIQDLRNEWAPPPPPEIVDQLPEATPVNSRVACPLCDSSFDITPECYGAVGECGDCGSDFLIADPAAAAPTTGSGIVVGELPFDPSQISGTIRLDKGLSMVQKLRQEIAPPPPPDTIEQLPSVTPQDDTVACPFCSATYEIDSGLYGLAAECAECESDFLILQPAADPGPPPSPKASPAPKPPKKVRKAAPPTHTNPHQRVVFLILFSVFGVVSMGVLIAWIMLRP